MSSRQRLHRPRTATRLAAVVATCCLVAACGGDASEEPSSAATDPGSTSTGSDGDLLVVATTSILGDVASQIVGGDGTVEVLMGPGVDPHAFQASAQQAQLVRQADLVIANGLSLEESLLDTLDAAEDDGVEVVRVAEQLDPIAYADDAGHGHEDHGEGGDHDHEEGEGHSEGDDHDEGDHEDGEDHDEGGHDHDHGEFDPHVWLDPVRMADGAELIAAEIAAIDDTVDDDDWETRGRQYAEVLIDVDDQIRGMLEDVADDDRQLLTNHDSFAYFADRYDVEVTGTVIPGNTTQADSSAEEFAALAQLIIDEDVPAIFTETTSSDQLATALAEEVGRDVEIVELYSGSLGEPGSEADTYVGLLRFDAQAIASALG